MGLVSPALAHQPVERKPDVWPADGRLFIPDGDGSAVDVIDFPDGRRVARLPVPPHPLGMGLSPDRELLFVFRGRSTEEDWVTVIRTGFDAEAKAARRLVVLASFQGEAPGGVEAGDLAQAFGRPAIVMEKTGVLTVYDGDWGRPGGVQVRTIRLAAPDHIHFVETDDALYAGFCGRGLFGRSTRRPAPSSPASPAVRRSAARPTIRTPAGRFGAAKTM
ncbi:hypothetical protein [Hydrogenibacillus sp. N12]|uniref:YncE family protein n=1 Tax=Hydrogenibacillus sp. N12 TaxID=2866627 RepID=UPI001C7E0A75|nr:hypothetical protein [Hydrogenibacillus sp. N12]QZA33581.1 hypothetical protein K2M58_03320 [Hydrogenibacillus sp. N12]